MVLAPAAVVSFAPEAAVLDLAVVAAVDLVAPGRKKGQRSQTNSAARVSHLPAAVVEVRPPVPSKLRFC